MSAHPISVAFRSIDVDPSPVFREQLRARLMAAVTEPEGSDPMLREQSEEDVMVKVVNPEVGHGNNNGSPMGAAQPAPSRRRRMMVILGLAASIAIIATLVVVIVNHQSESAAVDTSHDLQIAKAAIITPTALGTGWETTTYWGELTSRSIAESAATVEACEPYLDAAFDTAGRQAVTTGQHFAVPGQELVIWMITQWVTIFPSEKAASQAMDEIAEPGFLPCFDGVFRRTFGNSEAARLDPVPVSPHGDRQIVIGQKLGFGTATGVEDAEYIVDAMNVWVQVGRAIVFVDPTTDSHDSLDPSSRIELAVGAATKALEAALHGAP